jgi:two-component system LytT family response regulator
MKAVIVDDERPGRDELRRLLLAHPQVEIVGEAADAATARKLVAEEKPDLLFLDVQMPRESGFDLLAGLGDQAPKVIFTTAFDRYALNAFEFAAVDYLLKPIAPQRLARALARLIATDDEEEQRSVPLGGPLKPSDKFLVTHEGKTSFVNVTDIYGAESCGVHTKLWLATSAPLVRRTLITLMARLPTDMFFQANRAEMINCQQIEKAERWFSGSYLVTLKNGRKVELSRRQAKEFKLRFKL